MTVSRRWIFVLLAATFLSYQPILGNQFTNWDDDKHITQNPQIFSLDFQNIHAMFSKTINGTYIPLTVLTHALEYHFFGLNPFIFALNNLILHMAVVVLIYFLGLKMNLSTRCSFLTALLFTIHPMHVESVAWLTERKDVLFALFYLLCMHQYWDYLRARKRVNYKFIPCALPRYAAAVLFAFLSMLAKPMAYSLPFILWILDWFSGRRWWGKEGLIDKIPFVCIVFILGSITRAANMHLLQIDDNIVKAILTAIWTYTFYIHKFFWPLSLTPVHVLAEPVSLTNSEYLRAIYIILGVVLLCWLNRKNKIFVFGIAFFTAAISLLIRFQVPSGFDAVQERFIYVPSIGICFILGYALDKVLSYAQKPVHRKAVMAVFLVVGCILSLKTFQQSRFWKDSLTLWDHVIDTNPSITFAYYNRGKIYEERGEYAAAVENYNSAISLNPNFLKPYLNRGVILESFGNLGSALKDYNHIINLDPQNAAAHNNRGLVYFRMNRFDLALTDLNKTISLNPRLPQPYHAKGLIYKTQGNLSQAQENIEKAEILEANFVP